jgi:hypothetical protein
MNALLRAEARKALSLRPALVVAGFVVVYPALSLLPAVSAADRRRWTRARSSRS